MIDDVAAIDVRRDLLTIVVVLGRSEDEPHAGAFGDLDRLQHAFAFREAPEEKQVVAGFFTEREVIGVDAVEHGVHHVEAVEEARLFVRDGDERRVGIPRPQANLRLARRMMQCLHDRRRRKPREGE